MHFSPSLFTNDKRLKEQRNICAALGVTLNEVRGAWMAWLKFRRDVVLDEITPETAAYVPSTRALTAAQADALVELKGFAVAFAAAGWLEITPNGFVLSSPAAREWKARELANRAKKSASLEQNQPEKTMRVMLLTPAQQAAKAARKAQRRADYEARTGKSATPSGHPRHPIQTYEPKPALTLAEIRRGGK